MTTRRSFVLVGTSARASSDFRLDDLPSSSGRLDALLRCLRAGLMVSHGIRTDVVMYLVLQGGPRAPRTLRFRGEAARFLRPDERSLAILVQKTLAQADEAPRPAFIELRPGIDVIDRDLEAVLEDLGDAQLCRLDVAGAALDAGGLTGHVAFWLGDHQGLPEFARETLDGRGAEVCSVGPRELHAEDVIALVHGALDRA